MLKIVEKKGARDGCGKGDSAPKNERLVHYGRGCHETSIQLDGVLEHKVLGCNDGGFSLLAEEVDVTSTGWEKQSSCPQCALAMVLPEGYTQAAPRRGYEQTLMGDHGRFVGNTALEKVHRT